MHFPAVVSNGGPFSHGQYACSFTLGFTIGQKDKDFSKVPVNCVGLDYRRKSKKNMYYKIPKNFRNSLNEVITGSKKENFLVEEIEVY